MEETKSPKKTTKKVAKVAKAAVSKEVGLSIPVYTLKGTEEKKLDLPKELFDVKESPRLIAQYVRVYLANQRQGNASTKHRGEIIGTTKKVYRQKGTGNARHGSTKAPLFVGGGVDGGPKPTDHSLKMNKKQKRKALVVALSMKTRENGVIAIGNDVTSMQPKTKEFSEFLKMIGLVNKKALVIVSKAHEGLRLSLRNVPKVEMISTTNLNPYTILTHEKVLFTEDALDVLSKLYLKK